MDKTKATEALKQVNEKTKKRNFPQSYDIIFVLKSLDLKKTENQMDFYVSLHYNRGSKVKVAGLVGPELMDDAKAAFDTAVLSDNFKDYEKKKAKKLAEENDFFVAQANIMPQVAAAFGKVLGPKGKMPNPKAGCVVPPKANLKALYDRLQKTVRIKVKTAMMAQAPVGIEGMKDEEIIDNMVTLYNQVVQHMPTHENNISKILLKKTMGPVVEIK